MPVHLGLVMVKNYGQTDSARRLFGGLVVLMLVFALLPLRLTGWVSALSIVPRKLVVPTSAPWRLLAGWIGGAGSARGETPGEKLAREEAARLQARVLQLQEENRRLDSIIRELGSLNKLQGELNVQHVVAPVVGSYTQSAGTAFVAKAGSDDRVTVGTVAVGPMLQIIGRVTDVDARTCTIEPITARTKDKIQGAVMVNEAGESLSCLLQPIAGGVLRGVVEAPSDPAKRDKLSPQVGMYVRLVAERGWPRSANMLVIGVVQEVVDSAASPGRKDVIVRPTVDPIDSVTEVILRVEPQRPALDDRAGSGP